MQLYLECPCTSFPRSFARDFKETYRYPPPSTIYGLLLSLVGEVNLQAHSGVKLALGIIGKDPPISRIVRKQRHHKFSVKQLGTYPTSQFSKPNHHELLTDLQFVVRVDSGQEEAAVKLEERIAIALSTPEQIQRFGGLSLGESWAMLNGVRSYRETDGVARWLTQDHRGLISLPVWINRDTTQGTFQRFSLAEVFSDSCWVEINSPVPTKSAATASTKVKATRKPKENKEK
jgi:CRISPR-associated protein Cas5t